MARAVFGPGAALLPREDADTLAALTGRIGQYGFSFPAKRFTTQRFAGGPSLIERAGFTRQTRPTDLRDPSLPAADPRRDALGTGFTWTDGNWHVEQRRAYLLFSHLTQEAPVTLIVRNSSPFFGRDRLQEAAYVSFAPQTTEGLLTLDADSIGDPARFIPWQDVLRAETGLPLREKFRRASFALDALQGVDLKFSQWLRTRTGEVRFKTPHESLRAMFNDKSGHEGGYTHLRAFLKTALMTHIEAEKPGSPLYLAQLDPGETAPWRPHDICPVTADTLAQLKDAENGTPVPDERLRALFTPLKPRPLILMSGRYGDFPAAPVTRPVP